MTPLSSEQANAVRIIVADDQEWIRLILVQVVRQTLPAATIIETENGLQAFEAYQHGGCNFLISNHTMPGMDGMHLVSNVRRRSPNLPIVMVSVHPEAKLDADAAGANWFLLKDQIMEEMPKLLLQYAKRDDS